MATVATYVFIDLETTGLPIQENNRTKITELSLVAVKREHVLDTRPGASPRVQHKLTLCLNPGRLIQPTCTDVTGLCNDLLEHEPMFTMKVFDLINNFLSLLTKPVCLVAQNGNNFDFPILKNHLEKLKVSFAEDLLCADCFHAFYDILEAKKVAPSVPEANLTDNKTDSSCTIQESKVKDLSLIDGVTINLLTDDEDDLSAPNTLAMKTVNETTPKQKPKPQTSTTNKEEAKRVENRVSKARRRFPWSQGQKPTERYKLKDIYERLLNRPAIDAHRAENDCVLALECSVALAQDFVKWVDDNYAPFSAVKAMTVGVRLGE